MHGFIVTARYVWFRVTSYCVITWIHINLRSRRPVFQHLSIAL